MKIAFVLPSFDDIHNSFSILLVPILDALTSRGDHVHIFSSNSNYSGRFKHLHQPVSSLKKGPQFLRFVSEVVNLTRAVKRSHKEINFDIIHNLGVGSCLSQNVITAHACHAAFVRQKRVYGELWRAFLNPLHVLVLAVESWNFRTQQKKQRVIAVSPKVAAELREFHQIDEKILVTIPNGVNSKAEASHTARSTIRKEHSIPADRFVLAFAGNYFAHKGLSPVLEAMRLAKKDALHWHLLLLGSDPRSQWRHWIKGLEDQITICGHVENLSAYFAASDLFVMPSKYESFGLVYLEAASLGLPVVSTPVGISTALLSGEAQDCVISHPATGQKTYDVIKALTSNPERLKKRGQLMRERSLDYTQHSMVEKTLAVYDDLQRN